MGKFNPKSSTLTIQFDSAKAAEHFKSWLCNSGEQDYWQWMECREQEESGNITAQFDYHNPGGDVIVAKCGRMDKK